MAMNDAEIISNLKKMVDTEGVSAFENHSRANALISDFFAGNENVKTRRLIKSVIDTDAFIKVSKAGNSDLDSVCKALKDILVDQESLSEDRAEMALCWVCGALGRKKPDFPKPVPSKPQTQPAPYSSYTPININQFSNQTRTVTTADQNTYGINLNYHIKRKKKVNKKLIGGLVAVPSFAALFAALFMLVIWPKVIYPNMANEELYTPEIVQIYSGTYETDNVTGDAIITISSCDTSGNIEGFFEFVVDNVYGKYKIAGKITKKNNNGNLKISVTPGEWVIRPENYLPLEDMVLEISDRYQSLKCSKYRIKWDAGEKDREYFIKSADDFKKLANSNSTYILKNDIDLSGINWTPIEGFAGTLLGNGFAIRNLKIESSSGNVGFFSKLDGNVLNVEFENADIKVSGRNENVGILCGELNGIVANVTVSGSVTAEKSENIGGVCGYVSTIGSYHINDIKNEAAVTGVSCVGGCFGKVYDYISNGTSSFSVEYSNIVNSGKVTATKDFAAGVIAYIDADATGFGGRVTTTIIDCNNTGSITGNYYISGIVGWADCDSDSTIDSCTNAALINAEAYTGCIAGATGQYVIVNCSNEGSSLNARGYYIDEGQKYAYVGGIVGKGTCLENCTNYIDINYNGGGDYVGGIMGYCNIGLAIMGESLSSDTAGADFKNLTNKGNISGNSYVGGIIGGVKYYWDNGCTNVTATFERLKNSGSITATDGYAGGIAGYIAGDVGGIGGRMSWVFYDSINESSITGSAYVGGLFGGFRNGAVDGGTYEHNKVTIEGCDSTGTVTGESDFGDIIGLDEILKQQD